MAYTVRMSDPVRTYLRTHSGLSRKGRLKLLMGVLGLLRDHGDALRSDPPRRLTSGSPYFRFEHIFSDGGRLWRAESVACDSAAVYGVLDLVYVDCQLGT